MTIRRHLGTATGITILAAGLAAGAAIALPGAANADTCTQGGTACSATGSMDLGAGALTMTTPSNLSWTAAETGAPQTVYDTTTGHGSLQISDLRGLITGAGAGWTVTATATTFTGTASATNTIPDVTAGQVLFLGGGSTPTTADVAPASACVTTGDCTVPTNGLTGYPLAVPTGTDATPTTIYEASAGTGTGIIQVGSGANLATWAVSLPSVLAADTYDSTITMSVNTGP
jgi:hypothetical protein